MSRSQATMPLRVLLTGADGFMGRAIVTCFRAHGMECLALPGRLENIHRLTVQVDAVVHLAAVSRPTNFSKCPEAWETNVAGTLAVANFCLRRGAGLVLASTSGVYMRPDTPVPLDEDAPVAPGSDYAASKLAAEQICLRQTLDHGLACLIFRIFNPYGPSQDPSFVVPGMAMSIREGRPVRVDSPDAVRDFVAVSDVARAFLVGVKALREGECPVVNIGSGVGVSILELVHMAQEMLGSAVALEVDEARAGKGGCVVAEISRADELLCWRPQVGLRQGLASMFRLSV